MNATIKQAKKISFQGAAGAYSDLACRTMFPELETLPCETFEDAFQYVRDGKTDLAMIPVDNTLAGRVADVHHLMPGSELFIIAEHFQPIRHALLGIKGAKIEDLKNVLPKIDIYLMPMGDKVKDLSLNDKRIIELCIKHDYIYCDRTHIRIWGDKRGV